VCLGAGEEVRSYLDLRSYAFEHEALHLAIRFARLFFDVSIAVAVKCLLDFRINYRRSFVSVSVHLGVKSTHRAHAVKKLAVSIDGAVANFILTRLRFLHRKSYCTVAL